MTDVYLPSSGVIAPVEYGIIFVDWVINQIISTQGYSCIDCLDFVHLAMVHNQVKYSKSWLEDIKYINTLHQQGR